MPPEGNASDVEVRRATADDAQAIGAVFDAAVRSAWTWLGQLAATPMFAPQDWDRLVADHRYVNALSDEGARGVRRAYSEAKRARLTAVKDAYDPDNVFHLNHNIAPSGH